MADRLTVQEFFDALRAQKISPLVDTAAVRAGVDSRGRARCASYPIQERWPVLDLEIAYQQTLNELPDVQDLVRDGYPGTINLRGYDDTYTMAEWFGDFAGQWVLNDTPTSGRPCLSSCQPVEPGSRRSCGTPTKTPPARLAVHGCTG